VTQRNPLYDMGGLSPVSMGYGEPGTGKSLLIAATATLLDDYCKNLGIPFLFWPMPDTVVSTFQGGSAERMMNWMRGIKDPGKIIYAPIDDAENNLEERSRQGVSSGVREVIAVFLRNTEGAYAVHRGNALIQLFTNLPDQIDKAVLSRINNRTYIGGAQTPADFLDQDYLWMRKHHEIDKKFVNLRPPKGHTYLDAQAALSSLSEVYEALTEPSEPRVKAVWDRVCREQKPGSNGFFGALFSAVKEFFPFFTSRDLRNIQRAVDSRVMDFELPEEWLEKPDTFFKKDYETKKSMLVELMKANMKDLSFADVRLQETIRYLDNLVNISESARENRIEEIKSDMEMRREAQKRVDHGD
ncbi:MAG: AAA family ATPase, partial [Verrucomicrobiota bacterium]